MEQARGETFPEVPPHEQSSPICAYYLRWLTVITRALPQGVCGSVEPPRPCTLGIKRTTAQAFGLTIVVPPGTGGCHAVRQKNGRRFCTDQTRAEI